MTLFSSAAFILGFRYSRARKSSGFTAFVNRFALIGIALGCMALIVVTSVMNGFEAELKSRILGAVPQLTLQSLNSDNNKPQPLTNWQSVRDELPPALLQEYGVVDVIPATDVRGIAQVGSRLTPVLIQGIAPNDAILHDKLRNGLVNGRIETLEPGAYRIFIGRTLANQLDLKIGDKLRLIAASGGVYTPLGLMPAQRQFQIAGVYALESELDKYVVFTPQEDIGRLLRLPESNVQKLRFFFNDPFTAPEFGEQLADILAEQSELSWQVRDWRQDFGHLFSAVAMEKRMMWLMLSLIIAVAVFNLVSGLMLVIQDKRQDIAILQTMGARRSLILKIFLVQGSYSGVLGTFSGIILGLLLALNLNPLMDVLGISLVEIGGGLPVVINLWAVAFIALGAVGLTLIATLVPAIRAARTQPAEALRYE